VPLHPKLVEMLEVARTSGRAAYYESTPQQARESIAASAAALGEGPPVHEVRQIDVPARWGNLPANLYLSGSINKGLIVYLHGGGWCLGTLTDFDALARLLCQQSQCAVLLLDYAITWAYKERTVLAGADVPLMVAGDSAGGNLAAVAVNELHQNIPIAKQLLVYPVTDCHFENNSYNQFSKGHLLFKQDMQWFFKHYASPADWPNERISPLRNKNLKVLPPTFIALADHDVLHDEGKLYAQALEANGVEVDLHTYPGMTHGFIRMANLVDVAHQAVCDMAQAAQEACSSQ
jgi:acetyl esterase